MTTDIKVVTSAQEAQGQRVLQEFTVVEEYSVLKQQMTEMCQAWANAKDHLFLFMIPKFEKYDGHGDPIAHLKRYCNQLRGAGRNEELLVAYFGESLTGVASEWFIDQDTSHWHVWDDMAWAFVRQFQYNIDIAPDRNSLSNLKKKPTESLREYAIKWREQAAMDDRELIIVFLQAQETDYFQNMMSVIGKSFSKAIKIGEMVQNGLKTGRIISQAVLKAAT
ncbi:uncharacterized protein [Nicotiana tomentosiformis]|uniref:uncharacterized protein n=1 Tax=Nicotiana tomentosiformis TaxID=4098 RepID=UPI00388C9D08